MLGARSDVAANFHSGWPAGARTCAVPSPVILKWRSLVPFGAGSLGATSVTPPPTTTSMAPPLERTSTGLPAGPGNGVPLWGEAASRLAADRITGGLPV